MLHAYTQNAIGPYEDMKFNVHLAYFDEVFFFSLYGKAYTFK